MWQISQKNINCNVQVLVNLKITVLILDKNFYVTGTVTYAAKGREILRRNGIKAYSQRSFSPDKIGCGYGIVAVGDVQNILSILAKADVKVLDVKSVD